VSREFQGKHGAGCASADDENGHLGRLHTIVSIFRS
jgi:hypothetical protein